MGQFFDIHLKCKDGRKIMEGVAEQGSVEGRHLIFQVAGKMQLWWWVVTDLEQTE